MARYTLSTIDDELGSLMEKAAAGEEVVITGRTGLELRLVLNDPPPHHSEIDWAERLRQFGETLPMQSGSAVDLIRQMRDEGP